MLPALLLLTLPADLDARAAFAFALARRQPPACACGVMPPPGEERFPCICARGACQCRPCPCANCLGRVVRPAPVKADKTCPCSSECVCGCNQGQECRCHELAPQAAPRYRQPTRYYRSQPARSRAGGC